VPSREPRANTRDEIIEPSERDQMAAAALVTAGALVAIADKQADATKRKEIMRYMNDRELVPTIAGAAIAKLFYERVRRLEQPDFANVVIEALRQTWLCTGHRRACRSSGRSGPPHAFERMAGDQAHQGGHDVPSAAESANFHRAVIEN